MPKIGRTLNEERKRARAVFERLQDAYPEVRCTLDHHSPLQLLIMTILAAQCTDERVNIVCKDLFRKYRSARDFAQAPIEELAEDIRSCGFYRQKAKSIIFTCRELLDKHGGNVPGSIEALTALRGVGRKTANVILGECFGKQGVIVDTHCTRLANRLGFTRQQDPAKIERELMEVWPPEHWTLFSHFMVWHGRAVCTARKPLCSRCQVARLCPFPDSTEGRKIAQ